MEFAARSEREQFVTLDGSIIRELAGPAWTAARNQSLAEARLPAGRETIEHLHLRSEEVYYFMEGGGRMRLGEQESEITGGDCVVIPPGTRHKLWARSECDLVLLCACAPAYSHADTVLTEPLPPS
jgi:mannose-6-phosphate isomerase-like protein (cupin superfamily)